MGCEATAEAKGDEAEEEVAIVVSCPLYHASISQIVQTMLLHTLHKKFSEPHWLQYPGLGSSWKMCSHTTIAIGASAIAVSSTLAIGTKSSTLTITVGVWGLLHSPYLMTRHGGIEVQV